MDQLLRPLAAPVAAAAAAAAALLSAPSPASAAEDRLVNVQLFSPAADSRGLVTVDRAESLGHLELSFGLWASYARNPLVLVPAGGGAPAPVVRDLVTGDMHAALGLFGRLEVAFEAPVSILDGPRTSEELGFGPRVATHGLGDPSFKVKAELLARRRGPIGLAVLAGLRFPGGGRARDFMTSGAAELFPRVIVDGAAGRLRLAANLGVNLRLAPAGAACCAGARDPFRIGHELTAGGGAALALVPERLDLVAELNARLPLGGAGDLAQRTPVEALLAVKVYIAKNSFLVLGASWGLSRLLAPSYGAPEPRAFVGITYEPHRAPSDRDGDGYDDRYDACPDEPEDFDHFDDGDGCPELDNDIDGFIDSDDPCPNDAEDPDGDRDGDGCPEDPTRVTRVKGAFLTLEPIHFEHDRAVIEPSSYGLLYDLARALSDNPDVLLLRVEGHTDSDGSDSYNLRLSAARARAVRDFLVAKGGVAADRLLSEGYGERRPITTNDTPEGKAANRRVDFVILKEGK